MSINHTDLFYKTLTQSVPNRSFTEAEQSLLNSIAKNHLLDLTTNMTGYFDEELRRQVTIKAAEKLSEALQLNENSLTTQLWQQIVIAYHRNGQWGIQRLKTPPPPIPIKETPAREMFKYIWVFIQAGILMKAVVLYFGLHAASEDPSSNSSLFLYFALAFSFGSMALFAWRLHRKETKKLNRSEAETALKK